MSFPLPLHIVSLVPLQGAHFLAQSMETVSQVHKMFVEVGDHRLAVGEPGYPTLNSQPPLAFVSCVPDCFASVTFRLPSLTSLSFKQPSSKVVSFASPLASPLDHSGWKGIRGYCYGGHGLPVCRDHNHWNQSLTFNFFLWYPSHPLCPNTIPPFLHYHPRGFSLSPTPKKIGTVYFFHRLYHMHMFSAPWLRYGNLHCAYIGMWQLTFATSLLDDSWHNFFTSGKLISTPSEDAPQFDSETLLRMKCEIVGNVTIKHERILEHCFSL